MSADDPLPTQIQGSPEGEPPSVLAQLGKRDSIVIGRDLDCDLVIHDAKASRKHCRLSRTGGGFTLEDLGSRNGTYVNGQPIQAPVHLQANEVFKIGNTLFFLA